MTKHILPFIILLVLFSCSSSTEEERSGNTTVFGKVYDEELDNIRLIRLSDNPIAAHKDTRFIDVSEDGSFKLNMDIDTLTTGAIISGDYFHYISIMPGDELDISLKNDSIWFRGKGAERNNYLKALETQGVWSDGIIAEARQVKPSLEEFINTLNVHFRKRRALLKKYDLSDEFLAFAKANNDVFYETSLRDYTKMYAVGMQLDINEMEVPERISLSNRISHFVNDDYLASYRYVHDVVGYVRDQSRPVATSQNIDINTAMWNYVIDSIPGKTKDYALAKMFCNKLLITSQIDQDWYDHFKRIAKDENAIKVVDDAVSNYEKRQAAINTPAKQYFKGIALETPDLKKLTMEEMLDQYEGKAIYLEIWLVDWYPDLPYRPKFHLKRFKESMRELPVSVVQVALTDKSENLWNHIFEMSVMEEDQFRIKNPENADFLNFFEINSYPSYFMIDKKGLLRAIKAPSPPTARFSKELTDIEKVMRQLANE